MKHKSKTRFAFTIIEMLIAMAVTLIMMAALAQAFKLIGDQMQTSRAKVELSSQMRGLSFRLRDELKMMTANTTSLPLSPTSGSGYFVYYDGPISDSTGFLHGEAPAVYNENSYQDAKYGDFDDYIAFTAEAPKDAWFTGRVPEYILDPATTTPLRPRIIRSKYAEIIYWVAPETKRNPNTSQIDLVTTTEMPLYADEVGFRDLDGDDSPDGTGDGIPDKLVLHRRVLLIRPDLNVNGRLPTRDVPLAGSTTDFYRLGDLPTVNGNLSMPLIDTTLPLDRVQAIFDSHWMMGLTAAHQFFDLSIRRAPDITNAGGVNGTGSLVVNPNRNTTGASGGTVHKPSILAANSLSDLTAPENRFAHVRIPGQYFGFTADTATSMPLLALGFDNELINNSLVSHLTIPGMSIAGSTKNVPLFNGFLLPQFELSNVGEALTLDKRWDRTGEDILAGNVLAFDVKAFDDGVANFITTGGDTLPGIGGEDDDGSGTPDDSLLEYGARFSDDNVVSVNDPGIYAVLESPAIHASLAVTPPTSPPSDYFQRPALLSQGGYVDLAYAFQAGGPLRNLLDRGKTVGTIRNNMNSYVQSNFSGLQIPAPAAPNNNIQPQYYLHATNELSKSGKIAFTSTAVSSGVLFFQPIYDTWSDHYESDGFDQGQLSGTDPVSGARTPVRGTFWLINGATLDPITNLTNYFPKVAARGGLSGITYHPTSTGTTLAARSLRVDEATNGVDEVLRPTDVTSLSTVGIDDPTERETSPPYATAMKGLKIQIRLEDQSSREIIDSSVIHDMR